MTQDIILRSLTTVDDLQAMQQLELEVWQMMVPVPLHQSLTVAKNGGIILGAFQGETLVGMLYSFPGWLNGEVFLCSHMLAVRKGLRHHGLGARLKWAQAEAARAAGYSLITWTYDPLETANAYLNIGKLGAVCSTYIPDCYGNMPDPLNKGLPSDRFKVAWWLQHPKPALPSYKEINLINWRLADNGLVEPTPEIPGLPDRQSIVKIAVPAEFQRIKQQDIALARVWRQITGKVFSDSFNAGWVVAGFRLGENAVHEYLLCRREELALPQPSWDKGEK